MKAKQYDKCSTEELLAELDRQSASSKQGEDVSAIKREIVRKNVGLVVGIAREFLHSNEPLEDLIQVGYIGLLNAVHNFDLKRGNKFSTYATYLIKGEIRHYIRDKHGTIKIPQWIQELNYRVNRAEKRLVEQKGRFPTIRELAEELNISEEGIGEVLKARNSMSYVSIDHARRADDPRPTIDVKKIRSLRREPFPWEQRVQIMTAIDRLTDLQQEVIHGLFYNQKSQTEVGEKLGFSQRQISRLKKRALQELRGLLEPEGNLPG